MRIAACILAIIGGALQLILCMMHTGIFIFDKSITQLFYSDTFLSCLSSLIILLGLFSLKFPKMSGVGLTLTSTFCFFLGSYIAAPVSFVAGICGLFADSPKAQYNTRRSFILFALAAVIGSIGVAASNMTVVYLWNKQPEKIENVEGIAISAEELSKEYNADEKAADTKYLNKAIEVSGAISEINKNQDGGIMLVLKTGDPTAGIQCALREKTPDNKHVIGQNVVVKGFCSGNGITGVSLTDCVIK